MQFANSDVEYNLLLVKLELKFLRYFPWFDTATVLWDGDGGTAVVFFDINVFEVGVRGQLFDPFEVFFGVWMINGVVFPVED